MKMNEEEMLMTEATDIAALSFEKALAALEDIVARLEAGKVDLKSPSRSMSVVKRCASIARPS